MTTTNLPTPLAYIDFIEYLCSKVLWEGTVEKYEAMSLRQRSSMKREVVGDEGTNLR
jgi:hypothetical protein